MRGLKPRLARTDGGVGLRRNREFLLLQAGHLLSGAGTASTTIAYPLLALALTHSPAKAGVITFARLVPYALFGLAAGLAADRWNRRRVMIAADAVRAAAIGALAALILLDRLSFWQIPVAAFVEGAGAVFFSASSAGALRAVVPAPQLPAAVGAQRTGDATVGLIGPPVGGALFGLARAVPFVVDAVSYVFSTLSLFGIRTSFQEEREREPLRIRSQLAEGFRFLWRQPFIRTTTFVYALGNFVPAGLFLAIVVLGRRDGLSGGAIGGLLAVFGAFLVAGGLVSPLIRRRFSTRTVLLLELWASLGTAAFLIWPSVYVLLAGMLPQALVMPSTDSVVVGYRLALTPDRLLGRVESVRSTLARLIDPFGPLAAGLLLSAVSARAAVGAFVAVSLALAVWATLSPSLRDPPAIPPTER